MQKVSKSRKGARTTMKTIKWPIGNDGELDISAIEELACEQKPFKNKEGIEGRLKLEGHWPYRKLWFVPTKLGRRHPEYLKTKHKLHDDWDTDLSQSDPEVWSEYIQKALRAKLP